MKTSWRWCFARPKAAAAEIDRLRLAVRWALGEVADESGCWFGETVEEHTKPYGWRKNLRNIAGMGLAYDKASRTIVRAGYEQNARRDG